MFALPDTWNGGYFELMLELGGLADEQARQAVITLWQHPTLEGCYLERDVEPAQQQRLTPDTANTPWGSLYGIATLPNGKQVACWQWCMGEEEITDVLCLGVPMGGLAQAYPVGAYPFDDGLPVDWREELSTWLRDIGETIYATVPFRLGVIGWEAGGNYSSEMLSAAGIPEERWDGLLWPQGQSVLWYPPTAGAPMTIHPPRKRRWWHAWTKK